MRVCTQCVSLTIATSTPVQIAAHRGEIQGVHFIVPLLNTATAADTLCYRNLEYFGNLQSVLAVQYNLHYLIEMSDCYKFLAVAGSLCHTARVLREATVTEAIFKGHIQQPMDVTCVILSFFSVPFPSILNVKIFLDVTPCSLIDRHYRFGGAFYFRLS